MCFKPKIIKKIKNAIRKSTKSIVDAFIGAYIAYFIYAYINNPSSINYVGYIIVLVLSLVLGFLANVILDQPEKD